MTPINGVYQEPGTPTRIRPACSSPKIKAPMNAPITVPVTPNSEVPPMTAATIASRL